MKIGFVGAGKVGTNLAMYFANYGLLISGFFIRAETNTKKGTDDGKFRKFTELDLLVNESDIIFITVTDDSISEIVNKLSLLEMDLKGKTFVHTSGSNSMNSLVELKKKNAKVFTFHPLQTFNSFEIGLEKMKEMHIFLEYDSLNDISEIMNVIENKHHKIETNGKIKYHCAASVISNLTVGLAQVGIDLVYELGISEEDALDAFKPLLKASVNNLLEYGSEKALTGPIARGDIKTVKNHLSVLDLEKRDIYRLLAMKTLDIASNNLTDEIYLEIKKLLKESDENG